MGWVKAAAENRLFIHGSFKWLWRDYHTPITKVDPDTRQIFTNVSTGISAGGVTNDSFWYAYGLHEELDVAGEWVLDSDTSTVSAILPASCLDGDSVLCPTRLVPVDTECSVGSMCWSGNCSIGAGMLRIVGATNVTVRGINITGSAGAGLTVIGSTEVSIDKCNVNNVANGVTVMGACEGREAPGCAVIQSANVSLTHSDVGYTGKQSTDWSGGNRTTLTPSGFLVENNKLHDFGMWQRNYNPGVNMAGVGTVVRKNEFYRGYHMALGWAGNDHLIELNNFHHCTNAA